MFENVEIALVVGTVFFIISAILFWLQLQLIKILSTEELGLLFDQQGDRADVTLMQKFGFSIRSKYASLIFLGPCFLAFLYAIVIGFEQQKIDENNELIRSESQRLQDRERDLASKETVPTIVNFELSSVSTENEKGAKNCDEFSMDYDWSHEVATRVKLTYPRRTSYDVLPIDTPGTVTIKFQLNPRDKFEEAVKSVHFDDQHFVNWCGCSARRVASAWMEPKQLKNTFKLVSDESIENNSSSSSGALPGSPDIPNRKLTYEVEAESRLADSTHCELAAVLKEEV